MALSKSQAAEALELSIELLADLELERLPLSSCIMKAARLARLNGDAQHLSIFQYEISGYPSTPDGVHPDVWRLCKVAGRVNQVRPKDKHGNDDKNAELVERATVKSIATLEEHAETLKMRLSFFKPQPINLASANPSQYVSAPSRDMRAESNISEKYLDIKSILDGRISFVYSYVLNKYFELRVSSAAENIFESYRRKIDGFLSELIPTELRRLDSIGENISSSNSEDWANAVHSCRRLLQSVSDALYPPKDGVVKNKSGRDIKIGKDNYINRLVMFCEQNIKSEVSSKIISSNLSYIGERFDSIFSAVQKGSHSEINSSEAQRFVIHTYLLIGDILEFNAEYSLSNSDTAPISNIPNLSDETQEL